MKFRSVHAFSNRSLWLVVALLLSAGCSDSGDSPGDPLADTGGQEQEKDGSSDDRDATPGDSDAQSPDVRLPDVEPGEPEIGIRAAFDYATLVLVDEVDMASEPDSHDFEQSRDNASHIETLLGKECRVLAGDVDEPLSFTYRLGAGGALEAGKGYVLVVEYPEDQPRSMVISNTGADLKLGLSTGQATGDSISPPYVNPNSESINYPLSQEIARFEQLFFLHDRLANISRPRDASVFEFVPGDGLQVTVAQFKHSSAPLSAGAAVCRIALYEAPAQDTYTQPLRLPPEGLPKRHLFFREEMADGVVGSNEQGERALDDPLDWYEYKARLMHFLGMNTFSKDLLEFGHVQGWDTTAYPGGWFVNSQYPNRWTRIVDLMTQHGFGILPMYEYAGSTGSNGLGPQKRAIPLTRDDAYTHITWAERFNIDVSDPDALTDAAQLLKATVTDLAAPRPVPAYNEAGAHLDGWRGGWGYIDLGENWAHTRISEGWTRSRQWTSNTEATPFESVFWYAGSLDDFDENALDPGMKEETINFMTTALPTNSAAHWSADFRREADAAITPKGRYLLMKAAAGHAGPQEAMLVGWVESSGEAGAVQAGKLAVQGGALGGSQLDLAALFDESDTYRSKPAKMLGAWFRPRNSAMPMGFGPDTLARFAQTQPEHDSISRADLIADATLLDAYKDWWNTQRRNFLEGVRDAIQTDIGASAVILFTADSTECGVSHPTRSPKIVTDNPTAWQTIMNPQDVMSLQEALDTGLQAEALSLPVGTWGGWEWQHSVPSADARNYRTTPGIMTTYSFNHLYTVSSAAAFEDYRAPAGTAAIRHYCLNEDALTDSSGHNLLGYFVTNFEPAGPYSMMAEARAVANGDPTHIGYLSASSFNRGFPAYVRNFNANYLALPALESHVLEDAASDSNVVVRAITTPTAGTWLAVVNTSLNPVSDVAITLPGAGEVRYAPTGQAFPNADGTLTLDLYPGQLVALHLMP